MTRIQIHFDDIELRFEDRKLSRFEKFLRLVSAYGAPGKLRQVCMTFGKGETYISRDRLNLNIVRPFFENVHTLRFTMKPINGGTMMPRVTFFNEFMMSMPKQNLRFLHNVCLLGDWMHAEYLPSIRGLHLSFDPNAITSINRALIESSIMSYISEKPALMSFECVGLASETVFVEISKSIPGIEQLGRIQPWSNDRGNIDANMDRRQSNGEKWNYLNSFSNSTSLSLKSSKVDFSDCREIFRMFEPQNTIKSLELEFGSGSHNRKFDLIENADLECMTKLEALHLIGFRGTDSFEFLNKLFTHLTELTKCTFSQSRLKQEVIIRLLELARKLRILHFDGKITVFSVQLYKKLLKIRGDASMDDPLVVYIDKSTATNCKMDLDNTYKESIISLKSL